MPSAVISNWELSPRCIIFFWTRYQIVNSRCSRGLPIRFSSSVLKIPGCVGSRRRCV